MPNGDKVKAASKHGPSVGEKRQAIAAAKKKAFRNDRRLEAAHHVARTHEDSSRRTEHEENMLEQKRKREAKASKAADFFRSITQAAAEEGEAPSGGPTQPIAHKATEDSNVQRIAKHAVLVRPITHQPTEEELKARVDAMLISRRASLERLPHVEPKAAEHCAPADADDKLDNELTCLVGRGILTEAQMDHITDALAEGALTSRECLHMCAAWHTSGGVLGNPLR
ncbi:hypothetical protein AB1Y20_001720 [Prymnesium parvum]|uniref:Uncharacterized protein n=1 Tax=Prymnesium parvum TaxID=97485 RepID=A0AB34KA96_PRYPA